MWKGNTYKYLVIITLSAPALYFFFQIDTHRFDQFTGNGRDIHSLVLKTDSTPVRLIDEKITYNIVDYPCEASRTDSDVYFNMQSNATTEYTLENPTDVPQTLTLLSYLDPAIDRPQEAQGQYWYYMPDFKKYEITVDGQIIHPRIRMSEICPPAGISTAAEHLQGGFVAKGYLTPDTPVHEYVFSYRCCSKEDIETIIPNISYAEDTTALFHFYKKIMRP